jgi:nicotinate-nucleotide pyrophosphorylase (carboxylating)
LIDIMTFAISVAGYDLTQTIHDDVAQALREDVFGPTKAGDLTASLIPPHRQGSARVISRDGAVIVGRPWADAVFKQVDPSIKVEWKIEEGTRVQPNDVLYTLAGPAHSLLTAERTALNFIQSLSAVATKTANFVEAVNGTRAKILDTRKTMPGLRLAQKYAVKMGGGTNHRTGLYDGILIKENHIMAAGGVETALQAAFAAVQERRLSNIPVQIEVERIDQLKAALHAGCKLILLDNFSLAMMREAVQYTQAQFGDTVELEASGGVNMESVRAIAETGVHRISIGGLTKDVKAVDLSMRFIMEA